MLCIRLVVPIVAPPRRSRSTSPAPRGARLAWLGTLLAASVSACGGGDTTAPPPAPPAVDAVTVAPASITLLLDAERTLAASPSANGVPVGGRTVAWSSSDAAVATVSASGTVRGVRAGSAMITATVDGRAGSAAVMVENPLPVLTAITPATLPVGGGAATLTLSGSGLASDVVVEWNGTPRAASAVSRTQLTVSVAASDRLEAGSITIRLRNGSPGGGVSESRVLSITPIPVASVRITPDSAVLVPAQPLTFAASPRDSSGAALAGRMIRWQSDSPAIATIDSMTGAVTPLAPGAAIVRATADGVSSTAVVRVRAGRWITASGGTAVVGRTSLVVPAGAVSAGTAITMDSSPPPGAAAAVVPGSVVTLGPIGQSFTNPVTVALRWTVAMESGRTPARFAVHRWSGSAWVPLAGRALDVATREVRGTVSGFSTFAIVELPPNPVPIASALSPNSATAGSGPLVVTVRGSGFVTGSQVRLDGAALDTDVLSADSVRATIPASALAVAGTRSVTVSSPAPGGGESSALAFTVSPPPGTIIVVTSTAEGLGDSGSCTLRGAVQAANTNTEVGACAPGNNARVDEIVLPAGTIVLASTLTITDPAGVRVRGQGAALSAIEGNNTFRVMQITPGAGPFTLEALAMRRGRSTNGGGAISSQVSTTIRDAHFEQNVGNNGGAVELRPGTHSIRNSVFRNNQSTREGGAVDFLGSLEIHASIFEDNEADEGGAIETSGTTLLIADSEFRRNRAVVRSQSDGGVFEATNAQVTILRSRFENNTANDEGGVIAMSSGSIVIEHSIFSGNRSLLTDGGAIRAGQARLDLTGSSFSNNQAAKAGGAIEATGTVNIRNSTFVGSSSSATSGAIDVRFGTSSLRHVTVTGSTVGAGIASAAVSGIVQISNSIITGNAGGSCLGAAERFSSGGGNVKGEASCGAAGPNDLVAPDPLLGPLQVNGGTTPTRLPLVGSPALGRGLSAECLPTDQRGVARSASVPCDAGAVQVSGTAATHVEARYRRR